jgi:hypothetical protein
MNARLEARFVPWQSFEEWQSVRDAFFGTDVRETSIRRGILMVRSWMERGRVPTAIESTLNLFQLLVHDPDFMHLFLNESGGGSGSDSEDGIESEDGTESEDAILSSKDLPSSMASRILQHGYSSAIIRFVNELVDQAQKGLYATSITRLADQLGLPRFFVDLRHDGTHDSLPSLELLRWAAGEALRWLNMRYWKPEAEFKEWYRSYLPSKIEALLAEYKGELARLHELPGLAALVKSSTSRVLNNIDALFTSPRSMRVFLAILASDSGSRNGCRSGNRSGGGNESDDLVLESFIRALAKAAPRLFLAELAKMSLGSSGYRREWFQWGIEEMSEEGPVDAAEGLASAAFREASASPLAFQRLHDDLWPMLTANEAVPATLLIRWAPALEALQKTSQSGASSVGQAALSLGYDDCLERSRKLLRLASKTSITAGREAAKTLPPLIEGDWREDETWRPR